MIPVLTFSEVETSYGSLGFSILHKTWNGVVERKTMLFLRDGQGWMRSAVIASADTLHEVIF